VQALDLYAKIEPLIGFYDEYNKLYFRYLDILESLHVENILDVGCGNGNFLRLLKDRNYKSQGIDRSKEMVKIARSLGVDAQNIELHDIEKKFDCVTAIGDVLNYMTKEELYKFFLEVKNSVGENRYFVADINTLSGFEEVADGLLFKETKEQFLAIEANFEHEKLTTNITLFEKEIEGKKYKRYSNTIFQYYHQLELFKNIEGFELISTFDASMFGDSDKIILIFKT